MGEALPSPTRIWVRGSTRSEVALAAERVIEDRPLLRGQRLVKRLDRWFGGLQPLEAGRQELLHSIHTIEQGRFGARLQAGAELTFLLLLGLRRTLHLVPERALLGGQIELRLGIGAHRRAP